MLFSTFERTDPEPSRHTESTFQFIDRCKSIAVDKIRTELEKWLGNYPAEHRDELVSRFPSDFHSPFFELLLHELLLRQGSTVTVHPDVGTRGKYPDFAAQVPHRPNKVVFEATLCRDDAEEDSTSGRMAPVYDAINGVEFPFCYLFVSEVTFKSPSAQPSSRRIKSFLDRELGNIDPKSLPELAPPAATLRRLRFEDESVVIEFELLPTKEREAGKRAIGIYPTRSRWGDSKESLRRTLNAKAKRYGQIGEPFVIAVNTLSPWADGKHEWFETLFGTQQEYVRAGTDEVYVRQLKDGFWGDADSPKYTRVSAVIFGCALPWNVPRIDFMLYQNPWATHPLPSGYWKLPTIDISTGKVAKGSDGLSVGDILGLPSDWPGDLFPERRR